RALERTRLGLLDLADFAPRVGELLALRELIGVRTCVHSAVKLLAPAGSRRVVAGIFHTPYHDVVGGAALALGFERATVVQAPGGLPELSPDRRTKVSFAVIDRAVVSHADLVAPGEPAPLPEAPDAAAQAALIEAVLRDPDHAPPGAV